jgi:hypothetical protein
MPGEEGFRWFIGKEGICRSHYALSRLPLLAANQKARNKRLPNADSRRQWSKEGVFAALILGAAPSEPLIVYLSEQIPKSGLTVCSIRGKSYLARMFE